MSKKQNKKSIQKKIDLFEQSKGFKKAKMQINEIKELIDNIKQVDFEDMIIEAIAAGFDEIKVAELINNILEVDDLSEEDKQELEAITGLCIQLSTKNDILVDFEKNLWIWYTYLYIFQKQENYEMCMKITQVINRETTETINNLNVYFEFDSYDEQYIDDLNNKIYNYIFE